MQISNDYSWTDHHISPQRRLLPAILSLVHGNIDKDIKELFLFDVFYALTDQIIPWLKQDQTNRLRSIYTEHLAEEHKDFILLLKKANLLFVEQFNPSSQIVLSPADVCHNCVIENTFQEWLNGSCLINRKPNIISPDSNQNFISFLILLLTGN